MAKRHELISDAMLAQNIALHEEGDYGKSGHKYAENVLGILIGMQTEGQMPTMLDYGCGHCRLSATLRDLGWTGPIRNYDPALKKHSLIPKDDEFFDLVTCTDVLEHIEPGNLDRVLAHIRRLTRNVTFLDIATRPANKFLPNGINAHLIQESPRWWWKRVHKLWSSGHYVGIEKHGVPHEVRIWLKA